MDVIDRGQVSQNAAAVYDEFFVPALFQEWADRVAAAADIRPGDHVLDVACGTGVAARAAAERVGAAGSVVGLDVNDGMLSVAQRKAPHIEWRLGRAESLPFDDESFDAVVSQFGFMFFEDRRAAVREMVRVLRPGRRFAVAVWNSLERTPGYAALVEMLQRLFGDWAADGLRAPFSMGDVAMLEDLFRTDGLAEFKITTHGGTARFPSIEDWLFINIKGWVLADRLDDEQYQRLLDDARYSLSRFVMADGSVRFDSPAHIISAVKV